MDGLVAMCHFCEQHGPSVIFCTQVLHQLPTESGQASPAVPHRSSYASSGRKSEKDATDTCAACMAFSSEKEGLVSQSYDVKYVSSRMPFSTHLAALVKGACVRSLSCEVCPGGEGCIYFGDDVRGHALSYTFSLKDVHARGLKRWFSVLVLVRDRAYLLSAWTFLVQHIQQLVQQLQQKAAQVFAREGGSSGASSSRPVSDQPRRHRVISSRGLPELIDFPGIWERLHGAHVWLMLAAGERLLEVMGGDLGGLAGDAHTVGKSYVEEDSAQSKMSSRQLVLGKTEVIDEQEEVTIICPTQQQTSESASLKADGVGLASRVSEYDQRLKFSLRHEEGNTCAEKSNWEEFPASGAVKLPEHSFVETVPFDETSMYEDSDVFMISARELYLLLGLEQFEGLLHHLTLGFPLEVQCSIKTAAASVKIVRALKDLMPSFLQHLITVLPPKSSLDTLDSSHTIADEDNTCCDNLDVRLDNIELVNDDSDIQLQNKIISETIEDHTISLSSITETANPSDLSRTSSGNTVPTTSTTNNTISNVTSSSSLARCKSKCSVRTLTSSPSVEVYDALDMDTLVLTISHKRPQQTSSIDRDHSSYARMPLPSREQRWSSVRRPAVQNVNSSTSELMEGYVLRVEDMSGRAVCPPQRCCSVVRALAAACTNTALRDDTLHLTLRHTLHQWSNKARLWCALVKQHRIVNQPIPTSNGGRRDCAPHDQQSGPDARSSSSSALGYSFSLSTPPLLPKFFMSSKNKQSQQQNEKKNRPETTDIYPQLHASSSIETDSFRQVDAASTSTSASSSIKVEETLSVISNKNTGSTSSKQSSSVTSNLTEKVGSSSVKLESSSGKVLFSSGRQSHSSNNNDPNRAGLNTATRGSQECVIPSPDGDKSKHSYNIDGNTKTYVSQQQTQGMPRSSNSDPGSMKPVSSSGPKPIPPSTGSGGGGVPIVGVPFGGLASVVSGSPSGVLSSSPGSCSGPSSHLTASSLTVGVPVSVLQQMLLAVGAAENDVPMLQCWAYQSNATTAS